MSTYDLINNLAIKQNGVITKFELLNLGVSRKSIETMRKNRILRDVGKAIYVVCGSKDTWLQHATILTKRFDSGFLSHESVLHLYEIFDVKFDLQKSKNRSGSTRHLIHIVNRHKYLRNEMTFVHKSTQLLERDLLNIHRGIAHVSMERAIIDCSHQLSDIELSYAIEKSLRMKLTTLKHLYSGIETLGIAPGRDISRILAIIDRMSNTALKPSIESYFETRVESILLPISKFEIKRQYKIATPQLNMRVDFAIPELKIIIEADGYDHHGGRVAYDKDKMRYAILQSHGWLVLNVTTNMSNATIRGLFLDMQCLRMSVSALAPRLPGR